MIWSDFNRDWKTFIHTCLNNLAIEADLIYEIFCCKNEHQQKVLLERYFYWHCTMDGRKKGFAEFAANTSLSSYCRTLSSLWHNHHPSRRLRVNPFLSNQQQKMCSKNVFIDFGAWSIGAQRTPIMHFPLLLVLPQQTPTKGMANHNGISCDERFSSDFG